MHLASHCLISCFASTVDVALLNKYSTKSQLRIQFLKGTEFCTPFLAICTIQPRYLFHPQSPLTPTTLINCPTFPITSSSILLPRVLRVAGCKCSSAALPTQRFTRIHINLVALTQQMLFFVATVVRKEYFENVVYRSFSDHCCRGFSDHCCIGLSNEWSLYRVK